MEFYYGTTPTPFAEGKVFRNPTGFQVPDKRATHVYVVGNWPRIASAYKLLGVPVTMINREDRTTLWRLREPGMPHESVYLPTAEPRRGQVQVSIPANWESLPWNELRSLAASVSNYPITNKDTARSAVLAELSRRGEVS